MRPIIVAVVLAVVPAAPALSQWLNLPTPGIPRTLDGKPNLSAPVPHMPDGKPDLSGLWQPELTPYRFDVIQDLKDEGVFRPAAEALFLQRAMNLRHESPVTHCLPAGPQEIFAAGSMNTYRIVQSPGMIALLYELGDFRQIYMDGRALPKDPNPTWMGYSVAHWDGDTLVVETAGFNDKTWLDTVGHPHSEHLRVTEKFRRTDFGHMQVEVTYDDPETMTKPLTMAVAVKYVAVGDMLEYVCLEGERDTKHLVSMVEPSASPGVAMLDKYVGEYRFREGVITNRGLYGRDQIISMVKGQLYMKDFPLIPRSDTRFDSTAGTIEFQMDSSGRVTHFILSAAEGDSRFDRTR